MTTEKEMLQYATKFEFPETGGLRLSIEKIKFSEDRWLLKDRDIKVFDAIEHKLVSMDGDFSKCAPYRCQLPLKTVFFFVGKLIQWEKEEIFQYATEFEFPATKGMRITIEKGTGGFSELWAIRNTDSQIFDYYESKFIYPHFKRYSPNKCFAPLDHAFRMAELITPNYDNFKVDYNGRCHDCGESVGERNLSVLFGFKVCQECFNKIS